MISQKSEVLNQFFVKELMELVEKYNKLEEELVQKIECIFRHIQSDKEKQNMLANWDEMIQLAESMDEVDDDLVQFYFFVRDNICELGIEEAKSLWENLKYYGHVMIEQEDVIVYSDEDKLREYVEDKIDGILRSSYDVDRLFEKETLIDYFIEGVSVEEAARDLLSTTCNYEEILGIDPEFMFKASNGEQYHYGIVSV